MGLLVILQSSRAGLKLPRVLNCSKGLYHTKSGVFGHKPVKHDASCPRLSQEETNKNKASIWQLVQAFRENGHLLATINPLETSPELDSSAKKLLEQLDDIQNDSVPVYTKGLIHAEREICSGADLSNYLRSAYSSSISAEFMNCGSEEEKIWFAEKFETLKQKHVISEQEKKDWAEIMLKSELFDKFVGKKFPTVKRYGGEGAESMMVFFQEVFRLTASEGTIKNIVIGMAHRGRLNLLSSLLNFPPVIMFRKMQGLSEFDLSKAEGCVGDVLSHLYTSVDYSHTGKEVQISLLPNPSHLEAVSPAVAGKCRALALKGKNGPYSVEGVPSSSLPIQVHGDAAFAGQGVIVETLAMSNVPHFSVEGSIHLIINNQIGYTTPGDERGRSTRYCSDVMKTIGAPVIHVNGDSAADVALAARLALEYRQTFKKDVCIDLVCFRRWGHNEMDDPTFTNPDIYSKIRSQPETLPVRYAKEVLGEEEFETTISTENMFLAEQFAQTGLYQPVNPNLKGDWSEMVHPSNQHTTDWDTGVNLDVLKYVGAKTTQAPDGFTLHPNLLKSLVKERINRLSSGERLDWATAEALAIGSLLYQDFNVRISGQDVGRGTFSQRHIMLVDQKSDEMFIPLNDNLKPEQSAYVEVANSILSEEAVLAYEYGFSIDSPKNLVIWEAQFGDFFNGAQIVLDTFISSGEMKWLLQSGMVLLLPHGYDGAGPEHSSCHIERFLQMCDSREDGVDGDNVNWYIVNPTTPAQYFHLIRRQMVRNFRKPLIVAGPKMLLRHPQCVSSLNDFAPGTRFERVIDDITVNKADKIKRLVFCSGKHFYQLDKHRSEKNIDNVALVRLEELCPFPAAEIISVLQKYDKASEIIWSQEEQRNMGCWTFINARFNQLLNRKLKYVGRPVLGCPAVGIATLHRKEAEDVVLNTFRD